MLFGELPRDLGVAERCAPRIPRQILIWLLTAVASPVRVLIILQLLLLSLAGPVRSIVFELVLNLFTLSHEELEEILALLLHVLLILVDEQWLHDQLVEAVQVLHAAPVSSFGFPGSTGLRPSLIWMFRSLLVRVHDILVFTFFVLAEVHAVV